MNSVLLPEADAEIQAAAQWYEDQKPGLGVEFLDHLLDAILAIEQPPRGFPRPPKLRSTRNVRRCLLERFPYSVIYEVRDEEVLVPAVAHVRRKPNYWKNRTR